MLRTYSSKEHLEQLNVAVKIENLTVKANEKEILKDFNLEIKSGEIHVIMGPNGTGKSTLTKVIMGDKKSK